MMSGDIPCNAPCVNRWCKYNSFGHCDDNAPCAAQERQETHGDAKEVRDGE